MSRRVVIDFRGLSINIQAQCEVALESLCKVEDLLKKVQETSSRLRTDKITRYEKGLIKTQKEIKSKIDDFVKDLEEYKKYGVYTGYEESGRVLLADELRRKGDNLSREVSELTGERFVVLDKLISQELYESGSRVMERLHDKAHGVLNLDEKTLEEINKIEDVALRELAYNQYVNSQKSNLTLESVMEEAKEQYNNIIEEKKDEVIAEYKKELKSKGISSEVITSNMTIDEASKAVYQAKTDEKVRQETLKIIIKTLRGRGFVIDTKNNLKIDRESNIVKLVALKASGQKAEFEIHLNGKFMYDFDGYEGQACKKDIEPFMEDLKNIYDIEILHEEVIRENPDKIQTKKYQYLDTKKGRN